MMMMMMIAMIMEMTVTMRMELSWEGNEAVDETCDGEEMKFNDVV